MTLWALPKSTSKCNVCYLQRNNFVNKVTSELRLFICVLYPQLSYVCFSYLVIEQF